MSGVLESLELSRMAQRLVKTNVFPSEHVVVVTSSDQHHAVVEVIGAACDLVAATTTLVVLPPPQADHAYRHPAPAVDAARSADVVIVATTLAFPRAYDDLTAAVLDAGGRLVLLNNALPTELARGAAMADPTVLDSATSSLASTISEGRRLRLCTAAGTDFEVGISRPCYSLTRTADSESGFGSFPSGEAMLAVEEGTATGTFVATDFGQAVYLDGAGPPLGLLEDNIVLTFSEGTLQRVEGGAAANRLNAILDRGDDNSWLVGELGIGTNPSALAVDAVENKFREGTAHIALGSNDMIGWRASALYGGTIHSALHIDLVAGDVQIHIDGRPILRSGKRIDGATGER